MRNNQITFPYRMKCTHKYPDGTTEQVWYGQYEAIEIVKENDLPVPRTVTLAMPDIPVTHVERENGLIVIFDEPFYKISREYK